MTTQMTDTHTVIVNGNEVTFEVSEANAPWFQMDTVAEFVVKGVEAFQSFSNEQAAIMFNAYMNTVCEANNWVAPQFNPFK